MKTLSPAELDQAKLDPGSVFERPDEVLAASLTADDKKTILLRWEEDAEDLMRATGEGMPPEDNRRTPAELLRAVQAALAQLAAA
ncbi:hypothetical protein [Methyloceanibacter superfactus]|jgi:hypothetical protein|nr:hypothetical protein [Methyloceanibacter superfactus]